MGYYHSDEIKVRAENMQMAAQKIYRLLINKGGRVNRQFVVYGPEGSKTFYGTFHNAFMETDDNRKIPCSYLNVY